MEGPYVLLLASHGRATQRPVDMPSGTHQFSKTARESF